MLTKADEGWAWMVALGSFGSHFIIGYILFASGMVHIILLETFQASVLKTSWISAILLSLISVAGPVAGCLINKYSCRVSMAVGGLLSTVGLIMTSFVSNINWTFLTLGVVAGTGFGICYNTGLLVLGFNFERKRNIASGLAISGAGIGPFVLTPVYQYVYEKYHNRGYFLLLAGLTLQYLVLAAMFRESEIERDIKRLRLFNTPSDKSQGKYLSLLKSLPMTCLCLCLFLANLSIYLVYIHFPEFCLQSNSTKDEISIIMSINGICNAVFKILFGLANNSPDIDEITMVFGTFCLVGVSTMIFPLFRYYNAAKLIYSCILGGYCGCCWTVLNTIIIQILGHDKLADAVGYVMVYIGIGTFLGPPLAGFIIEYGGSYDVSFVIAGVLFIIAAFGGLFSGVHSKQQDAGQYHDYELKVDTEKPDQQMMLSCHDKKQFLDYELKIDLEKAEHGKMLSDHVNS